MNFVKHSDLPTVHSFLSPSKYSWLNYGSEDLEKSFKKYRAIQRGTELHQLASDLIRLGVKLPKTKTSFNQYVNDAIGYRMIPEQALVHSFNAFGTADSICFRDNLLRIHDLKTGISPVHMHQLEIYAALFCLEYSYKPVDIEMELRIYQSDNILVHIPPPELISDIMSKIILFDKQINKLKAEEEL